MFDIVAILLQFIVIFILVPSLHVPLMETVADSPW